MLETQCNGDPNNSSSVGGGQQSNPGTPSPNNSSNDGPVGGGRSGSALSAPSPVGGNLTMPLFSHHHHHQQQQQQQHQQQQAALAAAGLFRAASLAQSYPGGMVGQLGPHSHHLPSLMASLQAVASAGVGGVPLHHHHNQQRAAAAALGGLLPGVTLPFNFPSMSHQHQSALLNWSKLAQSAAAAAALGVDGLGSIIQQQQLSLIHI